MKKYYIYKIDLTDSYPLADLYDDHKYHLIEIVDSYEEALKVACGGFLFENSHARSWQEWFDTAEDGGCDFIIIEDNRNYLRRISDFFKEREELLLKNYINVHPETQRAH